MNSLAFSQLECLVLTLGFWLVSAIPGLVWLFIVKPRLMPRVCAWCRVSLGTVWSWKRWTQPTHAICPHCLDLMQAQLETEQAK